ncbi:hypothetical protein [Corynebacterium sp.]|nr:hypothetical protein [Corynebacterium sp.]
MKLTPRSTAGSRILWASASGVASPEFMVPGPILLTSRPERPRCA